MVHFKQACTAQEKRIQELESERVQRSRILPSVFSPALSTQPPLGLHNSSVTNKPAEYIDSRMVSEFRELGLEDQVRKSLSQSNNNLAVAADILMKPLDNTTTRVSFDENI